MDESWMRMRLGYIKVRKGNQTTGIPMSAPQHQRIGEKVLSRTRAFGKVGQVVI
jgi:hypothetical protein